VEREPDKRNDGKKDQERNALNTKDAKESRRSTKETVGHDMKGADARREVWVEGIVCLCSGLPLHPLAGGEGARKQEQKGTQREMK
jgi:hypothetical protein